MTETPSSDRQPIRILHVVGSMSRGGIETWLMHVLRHTDRAQFHMDFLVHTAEPSAYDEEIQALGSAVIPCLSPHRPHDYARNFSQIVREHGPYNVVHSHVHHFSGYTLSLARRAGIPVRIAHSHNDTSRVESNTGLMRRSYLALMRRWIRTHATVGLACSDIAGVDLYGPQWRDEPRWRPLYYGIDLSPYSGDLNANTLRAELGIPSDACVLGHIGRFVEQKNHQFLIRIATEVMKHQPKTYLLLVGDGVLRRPIQQQVEIAGMADRVVFTGVRSDVSRLMRGAMDVFVLPSLHEGLPVVLLEAQAAGLPCVVANTVTREADVVPPLMRRESLADHPSVWAAGVLAHWRAAQGLRPLDALALMEQSPFDIRRGVKQLERVYCA